MWLYPYPMYQADVDDAPKLQYSIRTPYVSFFAGLFFDFLSKIVIYTLRVLLCLPIYVSYMFCAIGIHIFFIIIYYSAPKDTDALQVLQDL